MIEFNEFETLMYRTRKCMCVTWLWGVFMDFEIYKKFADYNDSELANYYVNFAYKCSDYELFVLQKIMINRFLSMYVENDEV